MSRLNFFSRWPVVLALLLLGGASAWAQPRIQQIVIPGQGWEVVGEGYGFTEGPAADAAGNVYFTDIPKNRIHKIDLQGQVTVFAEETGGANGLMFGPDGRLYACQNNLKRIAAYDRDAKLTVVAEGLESNDLAISHTGDMYVTDPGNKQVWFVKPNGEKRVVDKGLGFPNGVRFSPDQTLLIVADSRAQYVYSYSITADGSLTNKQAFYPMIIPDGKTDSGADGMTLDRDGTLYVTTQAGLQLCDQAGRVFGVITKPQEKWLANIAFGGAEFDTLFATCSDKVYRRKVQTRGVLSYQAPVLPPKPRL